MWKSVCLDQRIVRGIQRAKSTERFVRKFGKMSVPGFIAASVAAFVKKPKECFSCEKHKRQVADLELGRQRVAFDGGAGKQKRWVRCRSETIEVAKNHASLMGRSLRDVVEQALLEHITRPLDCIDCPLAKDFKNEALCGEQLEKQEATGDCVEAET